MQCKIKTAEWILLVILTIILDIIQVILTLFVIGVIVNRFIDVIVGFGLPAYFWMRGISATNWKRLLAYAGCFGLEEVGLGGDDGLPFWTLEVIVVWLTVIADNKLAANPIAGKIMNAAQMANRIRQPLNQGETRLPTGQSGNATSVNTHIAPAPLNVSGARLPSTQNSSVARNNGAQYLDSNPINYLYPNKKMGFTGSMSSSKAKHAFDAAAEDGETRNRKVFEEGKDFETATDEVYQERLSKENEGDTGK